MNTTTDNTLPQNHHFRTDHLMADMKGRSIRGGAVTLLAQAIKIFMHMGSTAIIARLLTPADYGLIAMVAVFTGFVSLFKDLGLSMATVQRADITQDQVSMLFWINVLMSAVMTVVGLTLAPVVAWVNHEPRLIWITIALSATFMFGGLTVQHNALLQRQMRFKSLAVIEIMSLLCSILVGIALARSGASYWALVAMSATQSMATMSGTWIASGWRPGLPKRQSGVLPMLKFGGNLTGFNILNYFTRNFDNFLIGAFLGSGPLGIYSKAYSLLMMPISQINGPIGAVALPALSRMQNDPDRYRVYYLRAIEIIAFCGMPLVAFTFVEAEDIVLLLLGPQWHDAVPVFRWLAPATFVGTMNVAPGWLFASLGRTDRQFRWVIWTSPLMALSFFIGLKWGVVGVAASFSITWSLSHMICIKYASVNSHVRFSQIMYYLWRPAIYALFAASMTMCSMKLLYSDISPYFRLTISIAVYAISFLISCVIVPGGLKSLQSLLSSIFQFQSGRSASAV